MLYTIIQYRFPLDFFDLARIISLDFFIFRQIICLDYFFFLYLCTENWSNYLDYLEDANLFVVAKRYDIARELISLRLNESRVKLALTMSSVSRLDPMAKIRRWFV